MVNKNKEDLFEITEKLKAKDKVYVEGEKGADIVFCDKLKVLDKEEGKSNNFFSDKINVRA